MEKDIEPQIEEQVDATQPVKFRPSIVIGVATIIVLVLIVLLFLFGTLVSNKNNGEIVTTQPPVVEKEIDLLKPPAPEDDEEYLAKVKDQAVPTNVLTIGAGCEMSPLVIQFSQGSELVINNIDTEMHGIGFEGGGFFTVSSSDTRTIKLAEDFKLSPGAYRYGCNDINLKTNVGVMYITQ